MSEGTFFLSAILLVELQTREDLAKKTRTLANCMPNQKTKRY